MHGSSTILAETFDPFLQFRGGFLPCWSAFPFLSVLFCIDVYLAKLKHAQQRECTIRYTISTFDWGWGDSTNRFEVLGGSRRLHTCFWWGCNWRWCNAAAQYAPSSVLHKFPIKLSYLLGKDGLPAPSNAWPHSMHAHHMQMVGKLVVINCLMLWWQEGPAKQLQPLGACGCGPLSLALGASCSNWNFGAAFEDVRSTIPTQN